MITLVSGSAGYGRDWQLFRATVIVVMCDLVFETVGWLLDGQTFQFAFTIIYLVNLFTILLQPVMGILWFYYSLEELGISVIWKKPSHIFFAIPLILNVLLLFTNYWTNFIFTISPDNYYARGNLFWIDVIASFLYPAAVSVVALIKSFSAKSSAQKQDCYVLASFLLPPVIAAVIQVIWYGTFLFLIGFSVSLLIVFINLQNRQITVDFLTRTNNRASFISYYDRKSQNIKSGHKLYLFMIDVNYFKRINDTYGHAVGDQVLTMIADNLKNVCAGQKCFLARLGGDEFGILFDCERSIEAKTFAEKLQNSLNDYNSDTMLTEPLTLSVGYAESDGTSSIDSLMLDADVMMYEQKNKYHLGETSKKLQKRIA